MSKAARIRELLAKGLAPAAITAEVGCRPEYVQSVKQRLRAGGKRPCDMRWQNSDAYKASRAAYWRQRYATDPEFARIHKEKSRVNGRLYRARKRAAEGAGSPA